MRKKIVALVGASALALLSMTGCSSSDDGEGTQEMKLVRCSTIMAEQKAGADDAAAQGDAAEEQAAPAEDQAAPAEDQAAPDAAENDVATEEQGVIYAYGIEPQTTLYPAMTNEVGGGNVVELIFEGLTRYDVEGNTELATAESITTEDGGKTWNIKIKEGKKFSDGSPVTAASFVDAWNVGSIPQNAMLSSYFFSPIEGTTDDGTLEEGAQCMAGLDIVSDTEFTVTLKAADPEFDKQLGYSAFYPMPDSAFESLDALKAQGEKPVSNGSYMLANWEHDKKIELVPNPYYDGILPAKNGGVTFKMYVDDAAAYNDLLAGNLDVIDSIPAAKIATFKQDLGERAIDQDGAVWQSFTIPYYADHFGYDDEGRLRRQAISMAFDRQEICDTIFEGTRAPATDFVADTIPGHSDNIEGNEVLQYNPEKAKELWAQANEISDWGDTKFMIAYNADSSAHKEWVEAVVAKISQTLDIEAEPEAYSTFDQLRDDATNKAIKSALRTGWQADYPSAYNFMAPLYATGAGSNDADYANKEFDKVVNDARNQTDEVARMAGYDQAQAILMKDLPAIPLWGQKTLGGYSENVTDVVFNWKTVPVYQNIVRK